MTSTLHRLLFLLPLLLFLVVVGYFLVPLVKGTDPSIVPSALIDHPVPPFDLPALEGGGPGLSSADLKGKVQLVNVFASWCVPCRAEHPVLSRLALELGVSVRGIDYKDKPEDARAWLAREGNPYTSIGADRDGRVGIDLGVYGVPETFVVDANGRIRYKFVGPLMPFEIEEKILPLIKELGG
jgi:cytochrome c biogenesis protein CcmG/thiol:disulfide interchange protein DsbE